MRIYLAGPIAGTTDDEMNGWRDDARRRLPGHDLVDPTVRDYRGVEDAHVEDIVNADKADIDTCDVVIAYCPRPSVGTSMEVMYAWESEKTVFILTPAGTVLSPWLLYHSHGVFNYMMVLASRLGHMSAGVRYAIRRHKNGGWIATRVDPEKNLGCMSPWAWFATRQEAIDHVDRRTGRTA